MSAPSNTRQAARLRSLVEGHLRDALGERRRRVALTLSGGADSTFVGVAADEIGHVVCAYTFQLGDTPSFDSKWAVRTAATMGWSHQMVVLPTDIRHVLRAWSRMYHALGCRKKRDFECTWPFLYVYPAIRESLVLNGLGSGVHFDTHRSSYKAGATGPTGDPAIFRRLREHHLAEWWRTGRGGLSADNNPSAMWQHEQLMRENDITGINPLLDRRVFDYLLRFSWQELMMPRQKQMLRDTYPEQLGRVGVRNNQNYQTAGRISAHFEQLLDTEVNFANRGRTIDMFSDWRREANADRCARVCREMDRRYGARR